MINLEIFENILGHIVQNNILVLQKYYFIQHVPKYHQKLGCQANGGGGGRAPGAPPCRSANAEPIRALEWIQSRFATEMLLHFKLL